MSSTTTTPFTMSGRDEHEGQLSAGDEGRQEDVANIGDIGVQSDRVNSNFEVPSAEPNVEVTLEDGGQSGGELSCSGELMSEGVDETTEVAAAIPEDRLSSSPLSFSSSSLLQTLTIQHGGAKHRNLAF
ncbi:hypothetical protein V6N13_147206 [Hibiscus sabdariffa]